MQLYNDQLMLLSFTIDNSSCETKVYTIDWRCDFCNPIENDVLIVLSTIIEKRSHLGTSYWWTNNRQLVLQTKLLVLSQGLNRYTLQLIVRSKLDGLSIDGDLQIVSIRNGITIYPSEAGAVRPLPSDGRFAVKMYRKEHNIPGIVMGIESDGNRTIVTDGYANLKTGRLIKASDHVRIGSITKSFTVTVVLQLISERLLTFDCCVNDFIPGLQNGDATISQLMNMRSGIFDYPSDEQFAEEFFSHPARIWTPMELVMIANRNDPYFPPGEGFHYSNTNTVILGIIIGIVTDSDVGTQITERIICPLHLDNTYYPYSIAMPKPFAHGYDADTDNDLTWTSPTASAASGAMISNINDLLTWAKALGTGSTLSNQMYQIRLNSIQYIIDGESQANSLGITEYGFGIRKFQRWIGHTGELQGYSSLAMYNLDTKQQIAIIMNQSYGIEDSSFDLFREIIKSF